MRNFIILALGVLVLASLLVFGSNYALRLGTFFAMYAALALSWNIIGGLAGYPSFATAAFFGLGAYASAIAQGYGAPLWLGWTSGALVAFVFAGLIGLLILHLKGHYFAIASLAIAEILRELINANADFTGGGMGLNLPLVKGTIAEQAQFFYAVMLGTATLAAVMAILVRTSKLGFGLRCIQQNEDAAVMLGVDARLYKSAAFALSAVCVGLAGAIYANWVRYIEPSDVFDVLLAVKPLVMVLIGGLGTLFGPVIGAAVYLGLEELVWRSFLTVHTAALGLIIVALVLFLPGGIAAIGLKPRAPKPA